MRPCGLPPVPITNVVRGGSSADIAHPPRFHGMKGERNLAASNEIGPELPSRTNESKGSWCAEKVSRRPSVPLETSRTCPLKRREEPKPERRRGRMCYQLIALSHMYSSRLPRTVPRTTYCVSGWECLRCGHKWIPRIEKEPKRCPGCKSPYWNQPRRVPPRAEPRHLKLRTGQ